MIDPITFRMWMYRFLLLALAGLITFISILPLSLQSSLIPGPDFMLALIFAWVIRRPEYVPVALVAVLVFAMDLLFQNPPGLRAAFVVIGLEFLRIRGANASGSADMPFAMEWGLVVATMALIFLAERIVLGVFMVEQVSFGKSVLRLIMTCAIYPVVAGVSVFVFHVRRVQPGEADALRQGL